jgi:hypothetical protein
MKDIEFLKAMLAEMTANMKSIQAKAAKQEEMLAEIKADREQMLARMEAKMETNQAEMTSTICAFRSELKETIQHEMKAVIQPLWSELDETTACNGATETEPDPGMMHFIEEHQENLKGRRSSNAGRRTEEAE